MATLAIWGVQICTLRKPTREACPEDIRVPEDAPQWVVDFMAACRREDPRDRLRIAEICQLLKE